MPAIEFTSRLKQALLWALIASLSVAALMGILAFIAGEQLGLADFRLHGTNLAFAFAALTSLACALALERGRSRWVCRVGLVASAATFTLNVTLIWQPYLGDLTDFLARAAAVGATWAVYCPHFALLGFARPGRALTWVLPATRGSATLLAVLIMYVIVIDPWEDEMIFRTIGAVATLTLLGTITLPALHWIGMMQKRSEVATTALEVQLTCPRCGDAAVRPAGRSACGKCGLCIRLEIEEERCPKCNYVLYQLTSDRCPECGAPVFDRPRPAAPAAGGPEGGASAG